MKVEFSSWEDRDLTNWISRAKKFFRFHITPEESKMEIASIQLDGDAIQWYDLYKPCHGVPSCEQFKRELFVRFGPSKYENVDGQLVKIR
ncbi:hypothetical protein BHE74_00053813 [Ensete ventricosum]|nr:hypothetical protein BHE74_00053813 [Ensete ventricosum]